MYFSLHNSTVKRFKTLKWKTNILINFICIWSCWFRHLFRLFSWYILHIIKGIITPDSCFCFILFINNKTQLLNISNNKPLIKPDNEKPKPVSLKSSGGMVYLATTSKNKLRFRKTYRSAILLLRRSQSMPQAQTRENSYLGSNIEMYDAFYRAASFYTVFERVLSLFILLWRDNKCS